MNNLLFPPLTTNFNLLNVSHKKQPTLPPYRSCSTFVWFRWQEDGGDQIEVETAVPYHDSDSESEPEQLRIVSDFELLSGSDEDESTALDALAFSYVRGPGRGHAVVWDGRIEDDSSSDDDMHYNWASSVGHGRGRGSAVSHRDCKPARPGPGPRTRQNRWVIPAWGQTLIVKAVNLKIFY